MHRFIVLLSIILSVRILFYYLNSGDVVIAKNPLRETTIFTQIKDHIRGNFDSNLSSKNSKLLMGIVFGEKDLDYTSNQKFIATGVLHVVAASGMNVTMLISFVLAILLKLVKRQYALLITAGVVLFYTALADFQPSIVRAAIMASFALGAQVVGRQNTGIFALFLAAFAMIFWDPSVVSSISFILSFSATLGIILFDPIFKKGIFKSSLFEDLRTTTAAQIATTPILLFFFGTYSPISIVANLLVLWTIPLLMALGMAAAVLSFIAGLLAKPFILLCMPLLDYFWLVVDYFAKIAFPIKLEHVPWSLVVGYYLLLLSGILWVQKRNNPISK